MTKSADRSHRLTREQEQDLLDRVVQQDREALTELYRIFHPRLFRFLFNLTHSHATSDELVNDIMMLVWRNAHTFRGESKVSTWIFGIAYRQALRRVTREQMSIPIPDAWEPAVEETPALELQDWIQHGLKALPAAQRLTVVLVFYLGLSYEETAQVTGCPVNTVKTRMFHARRKLREFLEERA